MGSPLLPHSLHHCIYFNKRSVVVVGITSTVDFHVADNQQVLGDIFLASLVLYSGLQKQVKAGFQISVHTPVCVAHAADLVTEVYTIDLNQLGVSAKSQEVTCERTLRLFGAVQTQGNRYINGGRGGAAEHRAGNIDHSQTVENCFVEVVFQVIPVFINHLAIDFIAVAALTSLGNALIGIQSLGVYLSLIALSKCFILSLDNIAASECIAILETSLGGNLIELDFIPTALGHQTLQDVDAGAQCRQDLAILLMRPAHIRANLITQLARGRRRCVFGRQPLCQQRRGLALHVQSQLLSNESQHFGLQRSVEQTVQIVPSTELGNVLHVAADRISIIVCQPLYNSAEVASLALTLAGIADVEQAL